MFNPIFARVTSLAFFVCALFCFGYPQGDLKVSAKGTGQTTGHIATLTVKNTGKEPVAVRPQNFYIPSDGKYQTYVGSIPDPVTIPPGATVQIPVEGYCTDVHSPPVAAGEEMPPIGEWVPVGHIEPPDPLNPWPSGSVNILPQDPVPAFDPASIPTITQAEGYTPRPGDQGDVVWPGTNSPVGGTISPEQNPRLFAPVFVNIVERIKETSEVVLRDPTVRTPFSSDPAREREAVIQQTIWIVIASITGEPYQKEDFRGNTYEQFETTTKVNVSSLPDEEKDKLDTGVDQFWKVFVAVGVEAKVLKEDTSREGSIPIGENTAPGQAESTAPPAGRSKRCLRYGEDPQINARTGYDIIGELYRQGRIPADFVDVMRNGEIAQKVNQVRAMHHSLQTILGGQYNSFPCDQSNAHREGPQDFPDFPWDDIFLTVDLCADNTGKDQLTDFLDPNADPSAVTDWMRQFDAAVDNLGLWHSGDGSYMSGFQNTINNALSGIDDAYSTFEDDMYVAMALRFNRSRAESNFWSAVTTIAAAAVSAGIGAAAGGAMAAVASAFISTTGFIWDQGLQALGADPEAAGLVSSLITLSMGVSSAWGAGLVDIIGEEVVTGLPGSMIESGGAAMSSEHVEGYVMAMMMLDNNTWDAFMEELSEDYNPDAIARFNQIREEMRAEIARHVAQLCKVFRSLDALLPALLQAHEDAQKWLHSSYWRSLWRDAMDRGFDCCCEWSDGSSAGPNCVVTIPEFGHDPRSGN